jgi:cytochrome c oxidase cbb3-type subunit I/II
MVNGLLTLRGAWDKVREDPVLKFMVVGVTAYGMSTFEGPMMSLKNVNAIAHYTDYIIGHVHLGALAWNGGLAYGMLYYIIPRIYRTKLYSSKLANIHFWAATLGILFYAIPMYIGGIMQSLMWKEFLPDGTLRYANFLETVTQLIPMYMIRAVGGTLYIIGACVAVYNLYKTAKSGSLLADEHVKAAPLAESISTTHKHWHRVLEAKPLRFAVLSLIVVLIGGIIEYVPTAIIQSNIPTIASVKPYTPLELQGRDIYIREGCVGCHSQMIRPFRSETERYGEYSKAGEFVYDHPFLWGSKRTGPDLHRVGGKYPHAWHYMHMMEPQTISPGTIMPAYPWLFTDNTKYHELEGKIITMRKLGVPYPDGMEQIAEKEARAQAEEIAKDLPENKTMPVDANKEIIALIAYLQRLGKDIKAVGAH